MCDLAGLRNVFDRRNHEIQNPIVRFTPRDVPTVRTEAYGGAVGVSEEQIA
jgi:hypothetical protein